MCKNEVKVDIDFEWYLYLTHVVGIFLATFDPSFSVLVITPGCSIPSGLVGFYKHIKNAKIGTEYIAQG